MAEVGRRQLLKSPMVSIMYLKTTVRQSTPVLSPMLVMVNIETDEDPGFIRLCPLPDLSDAVIRKTLYGCIKEQGWMRATDSPECHLAIHSGKWCWESCKKKGSGYTNLTQDIASQFIWWLRRTYRGNVRTPYLCRYANEFTFWYNCNQTSSSQEPLFHLLLEYAASTPLSSVVPN